MASTARRALEPIWADAPPDRIAQVASYATSIAVASGDTLALRRWTDRILGLDAASALPRVSRAPPARRVAFDLARVPALRAEGLQRLRDELTHLRAASPLGRGLDETQTAYDARVQRSVRATYATLGRALALDGQHRAALDTLVLAAAVGWDVEIFRAVRAEALAVGDTAAALAVTARLSFDPRASQETATAFDAFGSARLGAAPWQNRLDAARREFVARTLADVRPLTITRAVPVQSLDGTRLDLRESLRERITVVAFLSRSCGPAIEVIPALRNLAARLGANGIRTIAIFEETSPSGEMRAFLSKHAITLPVVLDHEKAASQTFNQWGTPYFYVVDASGRIMFDPTSDVDDVLILAEAVRLSAGKPSYASVVCATRRQLVTQFGDSALFRTAIR